MARAPAHPQRAEDGGGRAGSSPTPSRRSIPLRLCKEIRDFMDRDCILCVDGQEILNYGRQAIPQFTARHRINSGAFGTMGVGMPFGVGAKVAKPDKQVIVLHGDGSFGMNAMEFDTAMRHNLPILTVISQNGGWTGDPEQGEAGPRSRLPAPRQVRRGVRRARRVRRRSPTTSARRSSALRRRWPRESRRWSASSPTTTRAPPRRRSRTIRPERGGVPQLHQRVGDGPAQLPDRFVAERRSRVSQPVDAGPQDGQRLLQPRDFGLKERVFS